VIAILLLLSSISAIFYLRIKKLNTDKLRQKWFTDQLIESQESERFRIASELHDGLGQQILVIKNRVEMAKKSIENKEELNYQLEEILNSAVSSIKDVRSISHGLRPVHLENFGITEAINNLCEQQNESSTIEWSYHIDELAGLIPEQQEIHFYRVIQEAISNIHKHSEATEASVIIKVEHNLIKVTLWDDGKGFKASEQKKSSLGFIGMQERIDSLGGSLHIQSGDGKGTSIKIEIPIN
jgi:signal transduction histidine kinase